MDPAGIIAGIVLARLSFLVRAAAVIAIGREEEEGEQEEGEALVPVAVWSRRNCNCLCTFWYRILL